MVKSVESSSFFAPIFREPNLNQRGDYSFTCSSLKSIAFYPLLWVRDRTSLATEELEIFEKLIEGTFWGGAACLYDLSIGEVKLKQVDEACDMLYKILSDKWFPNIEGILFLRQNLLKIQMRVCAALGKDAKVDAAQKLFKTIGGKIPPDIVLQMGILKLIAKPIVRFFIRIVNFFVKITVKLLLFFPSSK